MLVGVTSVCQLGVGRAQALCLLSQEERASPCKPVAAERQDSSGEVAALCQGRRGKAAVTLRRLLSKALYK